MDDEENKLDNSQEHQGYNKAMAGEECCSSRVFVLS